MVSHGIGNKNASAAKRRLAPLALLCVLLMSFGITGAAHTAPADSSVEATPAVSDVSAVRRIVGLELRRQGALRSFEVVTDGPVIWTSFRDGHGRLVVELPNSNPAKDVLALDLSDDLVRSAAFEVVAAGQRPMSRLVVDTSSDVYHAVVPTGDGLVVELTPVPSYSTSSASAISGELEIQKATVFQDDTGSPPLEFGPAPSGVPATQLQGVDVTTDDGTTTVWVAGDGAFYYSHFPLTDPHRFVVDLIGVVNTSPVSTIVVQGELIDGIRVAQYKPQPELVSRVVIDLVHPSVPTVDATPEGLKLTFAASEMATEEVAESMVEPLAAETVAMTETEVLEPTPDAEPSEPMTTVDVETDTLVADTMAAEQPEAEMEPAEMAAVATEPEAAQILEEAAETMAVEPEEVEPTPTWTEAETPAMEEAAEEAIAEAEPAPMWEEDPTATATVAELEPAEAWQEPEEVPVEEAAEEMAEEVAEEAAATMEEPAAAPTWEEVEEDAPTWDEPSEAAGWEEEEAPAWEEEPEPAAEPAKSLFNVSVDLTPEAEVEDPSGFETRDLTAADGTVYTGEPMTLSLQDADVKDVLRSFAQISGLNVVVQPGVTGSVTIEFTDVPWDQALDQILRINGLDYQLEGTIMRVAPVSVLRQEAEEQARLEAAKALSIPLKTIMRRVSYATATDIATILSSGGGGSIMSDRGSAIVDSRTNTLIIKELPSHINTVIAVIENLDIPEPQVMIEARIIETTKRFSKTLGIQLGFDAVASAERGNTTGLQFPNTGTADGGVNLLTGGSNGFLGITMGNVLGTFNLDAFLQAAESEGLINILSAPRITTLNNEQASIQSGLQIPIQTIANNTVSVQFVNATLRLDVTPHVTAEGTVLMDIDIQKREPQLAFAVVGASNAPISTKDASTRVIVRDGGTTVIGGIYKVTSDQGEDRVPGLSNIPILKHLFKNKRRNDENEELLIFITPRVVKL
ncbi:MAG: type IV pilus secretin PilQ [bacterium]|nr:type IV pilus secretin PilQ [bacterium]